LFFLVGCGPRLPGDFERLSLAQKIDAYEAVLDSSGIPLERARGGISMHGVPAAELMAQVVAGRETGLPRTEALVIIQYVQLRGCNLRATQIPNLLQQFVEGHPGSDAERRNAQYALDYILNGRSLPGGPDGKGAGACR